MTNGWSSAPRSNATSTSSPTSGSISPPPPDPPNCTVLVQSLTYMSSSHGNRSLTRPCRSGSLTSVTRALATPGSRVAAGAPPEASPYSERHCRPLTVSQVS